MRREEIRLAVQRLEAVVERLEGGDAYAVLEQLEDVIGQIVWWLWAELRDVDEGGLG